MRLHYIGIYFGFSPIHFIRPDDAKGDKNNREQEEDERTKENKRFKRYSREMLFEDW